VQTALLRLRRSLGKTLRRFKQAQDESNLLENEEVDDENRGPV
jgi:Sec-independent protein translocase protein TatA